MESIFEGKVEAFPTENVERKWLVENLGYLGLEEPKQPA